MVSQFMTIVGIGSGIDLKKNPYPIEWIDNGDGTQTAFTNDHQVFIDEETVTIKTTN